MKSYLTFITNTLRMMNSTNRNLEDDARNLIDLEKKLAKVIT